MKKNLQVISLKHMLGKKYKKIHGVIYYLKKVISITFIFLNEIWSKLL